ncbi:sensor histidine kinase [Streptacidiphilus sp. PB12-B1b]|uniref:sensor histidine kinase n=1 Tax=Streptacidiphilus sp. PB12-B1b TaxID=2705012 RepID=UPI0015FE4E03|nr:histidine kinase [Streptacidiphilus sp. PB12-B1b]QMU76774.1 sensor histidine kinase [Streptacidiphilus sp. PB12-B1b]
MAILTGWWQRRSDPARIELYTRSSFHFFALSELGMLAGSLIGGAPPGAWIGLLGLVAAHAALCALLSARGLDWLTGRRERPVRLLVAVAALSVAGAVLALALRTSGVLGRGVDVAVLAVGLIGFGLGAMVLGIHGLRELVYCLLGAAALLAAACAALGLPGGAVAGFAAAALGTGALMMFTNGCSVWLMSVVRELDAARELESQLAVAEERLRFGRDLHDVMGRNLAVIALKSELAAQLARHGRAEAVEQMIEVQRIARESQREVRAVVRGYRRADLATELTGALSVLRAAGIDGRAEGQDGDALPSEVQAALGWVVREATTNVLRHSEARSCTIRLTTDGAAVLSVVNDGVPADSRAPSGSGLVGLRERLAVLGGALAVEAGDGSFRLTAEVPLPEASLPEDSAPEASPARQRSAAL